MFLLTQEAWVFSPLLCLRHDNYAQCDWSWTLILSTNCTINVLCFDNSCVYHPGNPALILVCLVLYQGPGIHVHLCPSTPPLGGTLVLISAVTTVVFACSDFGHLQVRLGTSRRCRRAGGGDGGRSPRTGGRLGLEGTVFRWMVYTAWMVKT